MSNQIRLLVKDSLLLYREFFERFNQHNQKTPKEIVELEMDCNNPIEDVFLHVKIFYEQNKLIFVDDLYEIIKPDLLKVIDNIVKTTLNFARPEQ